MRFIVIGAGGIGGWLIRALAPTIAYSNKVSPAHKKMIIVDGDSFEPRNAERQDFELIGPKPEVRAIEMSQRYPSVEFIPLNKWVVEKTDDADAGEEVEGDDSPLIAASTLIKENDVVFCVVDNFATRAVVTDAASKLDNVDLFHAGNDDGYFGSYYHYQRREGMDVTQNPLWKDEFANPTDRNPGELSCEERAAIDGGTQLIWTNMAVASMVGVKFSRAIIDGIREPESDESFFYFETVKAGGRDRTDLEYANANAQETDENVPA